MSQSCLFKNKWLYLSSITRAEESYLQKVRTFKEQINLKCLAVTRCKSKR